jgi:serine/threonine-protein kinase
MSSEPPAQGARRTLRIGKYEVLSRIAIGGMGVVYRARDVELGREVALKVLTNEMAARPVMLERFRREARSAAKLRHEHIVSIYEFDEFKGTHYLAMEFVDGIDLHEYINQKGRLDPEEARQITMQAARALEHAHQQGIVHRDIKPSNFLIAQKDGRPFAKLTDLGLARETREEEFRVTRDGTTVGTVDYMSPEQARDSGLADIRSDIYSLGCTLYHMLAGQAPFAEGSIVERIYKHVEKDPEDIRDYNPEVSAGLAAVLRRMMSKKPEDRYQTPAQLLKDLENPEELAGPPSRDLLAGLADGVDERPRARKPASEARKSGNQEIRKSGNQAKSAVRKAKSKGEGPRLRGTAARKRAQEEAKRADDAEEDAEAEAPRRDLRPWIFGGLTVAVLAAGAVWGILANGKEDEPDREKERPPAEKKSPPKGDDQSTREPKKGGQDNASEVVKLPQLYRPRVPLDKELLRREFRAPDIAPVVADAQVFQVSRGTAQGNTFASVSEAIRQAPPGKDTVIEIHDNGPLFERSAAVAGRHVVLRAGRGYRPLIAWDAGEGKESRFLSIGAGTLTLEGLDVVAWNEWQGTVAREPAALFRVMGGRLAARDCTFATAGRHPLGLTLVELWSGDGGVQPAGVPLCFLSRCFARGADLTVAAARSPGATIHVDGCLLVGCERPAFQVSGSNSAATSLQVVRSTLVSGKTLLQVTAAGKEDLRPQVQWSSWDSLLALSNPLADGDLVLLAGGATADEFRWRAVNCLYAGWTRLLTGRERLLATDLDGWHRRWGQEGDGAIHATWPPSAPADPEEASPRLYRTAGTDAAFAATAGPGALGCDVDGLLKDWPRWTAAGTAWLALTYKPFPTVAPAAVNADHPLADDTIDVSKEDLGARLGTLAATLKPGARLVLRLTGRGACATSPVRVRGMHLVLVFDEAAAKPKKKGPGEALVLVPRGASAVGQEAMFDVEDGSLELRGGGVRFGNSEFAKLPRYMLRGKNADLRLYRCRLDGPVTAAPPDYRGVIRLEGSGKGDIDKTPACVVAESVLVSKGNLVQVAGTGARLSVTGSLLVAADDVLRLDPGASAAPPLNVQCLLERNTVAVKGALIHLADVPGLPVPAEPIIVQADSNLFFDPFNDGPHRSTLLRFEGQALPRGLLLWQGKDNGYDEKRLHNYVTAGPTADATQPITVWTRLWGSRGELHPRPRDLSKSKYLSFSLTKLPLAQLARSMMRRAKKGEPPLGADLSVLRLGNNK